MTSLVERLERKREVYNGRGTFRDELVNPDDPEAAETIKALCEAWQEYFAAVEALAELERNSDTTKRFDEALYRKSDAEEKARRALERVS